MPRRDELGLSQAFLLSHEAAQIGGRNGLGVQHIGPGIVRCFEKPYDSLRTKHALAVAEGIAHSLPESRADRDPSFSEQALVIVLLMKPLEGGESPGQ